MSKKTTELRFRDHLKDQQRRDQVIGSLDASGLIPDRNPNLLYELGCTVECMMTPDEFDLPPRGDPASKAPLPQFKK